MVSPRRLTQRTPRREAGWLVLGLLCGVQVMLVLDFSIVNVALPEIARGLGFRGAAVSSVLVAYALTYGGFLLFGGRLSDLVGRRRMLEVGLVGFGAASLVGGLAVDQAMLVTMRALQGVAAALAAPAVLSLVTTVFPAGRQRNRALGWFSAAGASGFAVGAMAGGLLTQFAGWRAVLFVNVPLVAVAVLLLRRLLPNSGGTGGRHDLGGALLSTCGLAALIVGVMRAGQPGPGPAALGIALPLLAAALLLGAFLVVEARMPQALLPPRLFRSRSLSAGNGLSVLLFVSAGAMPLLLSMQLQRVLGLDPLQTGLAFMPSALMVAVSAQVAPRLAARFGTRRVLATGCVLVGVGCGLLARVGPGSDLLSVVLPGTITFGLGLGAAVTTVILAGTREIPASDQGVASGLLTSTQQVGAALGVAVLASVAGRRAAASSEVGAGATAGGIRVAFLAAAGTALAASVVALFALPPHSARPDANRSSDRRHRVPLEAEAAAGAHAHAGGDQQTAVNEPTDAGPTVTRAGPQ